MTGLVDGDRPLLLGLQLDAALPAAAERAVGVVTGDRQTALAATQLFAAPSPPATAWR